MDNIGAATGRPDCPDRKESVLRVSPSQDTAGPMSKRPKKVRTGAGLVMIWSPTSTAWEAISAAKLGWYLSNVCRVPKDSRTKPDLVECEVDERPNMAASLSTGLGRGIWRCLRWEEDGLTSWRWFQGSR